MYYLLIFHGKKLLDKRLSVLSYTYSARLVEIFTSWEATILIFETTLKLQLEPCCEMC